MANETKSAGSRKGREDYTNEAYQGIRRMFFNNEIIPGQKISYRELAERLNMSATPVIQALKRLEYQGFVRHEPNRGYYTEAMTLEEITEIYDFRELIEVSLIRKTIEGLTDVKVERLRNALERHLNAVRDIYLKERLMRDKEFHLILAELSDCTLQVNTLKHLFDLLYLKYRGNILFVTPMETVDREHSELFESIVQRDADRAARILGQHIANVKTHAIIGIQKVMEQKQSSTF